MSCGKACAWDNIATAACINTCCDENVVIAWAMLVSTNVEFAEVTFC